MGDNRIIRFDAYQKLRINCPSFRDMDSQSLRSPCESSRACCTDTQISISSRSTASSVILVSSFDAHLDPLQGPLAVRHAGHPFDGRGREREVQHAGA